MWRNRRSFYLWTLCVSIVLIALASLFGTGSKYIGKKFTQTVQFQDELTYFYERLSQTVLNPIDPKEAVKEITVSRGEIEEHRTRYGTLAEQITTIMEQYEQKIYDAEQANNELLKKELMKERDTKIEDIRQNFESDAHVEAKIRAEKEAKLYQVLHEWQSIDYEDFDRYHIAYRLEDVETGKVYTSGDLKQPAVYRKVFNEKKGYFKAHSVRLTESDIQNPNVHYDEKTVVGDAVTMEVPSLSFQNPIKKLKGEVIIPESTFQGNYQYIWFQRSKIIAYSLWIVGVLSLLLLITKLRFQRSWVMDSGLLPYYERLPLDFRLLISMVTAFFGYACLQITTNGIVHLYSLEDVVVLSIFIIALVPLVVGLVAFQIYYHYERWNRKGGIEEDIAQSFAMRLVKALPNFFLRRGIGGQMFILLVGFFLAGLGLAGAVLAQELLLIYVPLVLFFGLPALYLFITRTAYLNRIFIATEAMAEGRLHTPIDIQGKSPLATHAKNLNNLREGVRVSMMEQAKSERLKTELITNVSHDLRTPLTSIITYTDLLKNEQLSSEDRAKYVDILDRKSQRLKTLIEDLFEVSKMASGNLTLYKQQVDLTQLLQQTLAEHAEEIAASGLDFRTKLPEAPLYAAVDGQRWWRVLDNLIVNALKYSLPGTRVYITLQEVGNEAQFIVKNITKYEIGENTDELFERFKRGDTSRHTDGSGLGLAIAQSIIDLHGGSMKIDVDGDLFKVTASIPTRS